MQVSEGNVLAHLGIIEQRTNEILQVMMMEGASIHYLIPA